MCLCLNYKTVEAGGTQALEHAVAQGSSIV